jgi:hypothetical protein
LDLTSIKPQGAVTLALGQRTSSSMKGRRVKMKPEVAADMRRIAGQTVEQLAARSAVPYSDDLDFNADDHYMLVRRNTLVVHRPASRRGRKTTGNPTESRQIEMSPAALEIIDMASSLEQIGRDELSKKSFAFYAAVVGDNPERRIGFVKQMNPYRAAQMGHLSTLFGDGLTKLDDPILTFALDFDMVVTPEYVAVLDPAPFERLFRDIDSMKARVPVWSQAATTALPFDDESARALREKAATSTRVASQLRGLYERGYLAKTYSMGDLGIQLKERGFDPKQYIHDGKLAVPEADISVFLKIIDEKLYPGWHSGTEWDVGTRARR